MHGHHAARSSAAARAIASQRRPTPPASTPFVPSLADPGFSVPTIAPGSFDYTPAASPWGFAGFAGVGTEGSPWRVSEEYGPAPTPQFGFWQYAGTGGSAGQSVDFGPGGIFQLSGLAAQRLNYAPEVDAGVLVITLDGAEVGRVAPAGPAFAAFAISFEAPPGVHRLGLAALDLPGDNTVLVASLAFA